MTTLKAFRMDSATAKKLKKVAQEIKKPETYVVLQALRCYFEEYMDYQIAKERFEDHTDKIIPAEEMWRRLNA